MYFFDKKTMYLVWNMQEGQARGVGTVKFLAMDEICRIEVVITGCGKVQGTYPVYVLSGDMQSLLGEIALNKGKGNLYIKCGTNTLGHKAFPYRQVTGLHIDLKTEGYLEQKWLPMLDSVPKKNSAREESVREQRNVLEDKTVQNESGKKLKRGEEEKVRQGTEKRQRMLEEEKVRQGNEKQRRMREEKVRQRTEKQQRMPGEEKVRQEIEKQRRIPEEEENWLNAAAERKEKRMTKTTAEPKREAQEEPIAPMSEISEEPETKQQIKKASDEVKPPEKNTMTLHPNKWQQLCAIYPVVHPFRDGRAYLSIEPRDFVVLQERYQPMVQNSFLLHGFYHYRHLLLGRHQQGKNVQYYLGVPGVFYEKEKAAALFYGFESFEGEVTPSKEGSFGYYMKRVQI